MFADLQISSTFAVLESNISECRFTPWGNRLIARRETGYFYAPMFPHMCGAEHRKGTSSYETRLYIVYGRLSELLILFSSE